MINIISKSLVSDNISGPNKVVKNLIKGLDMIGYPYVINRALDTCSQLWIHDDVEALQQSANLSQAIKIIAGPNLFVLPRNIPASISLKKIVYIHPSLWVCDFWHYLGFNKCTLDSWPTGIDTTTFCPSNKKRERVLIYFKQRYEEELYLVEEVLKQKNINYSIISYGAYKEDEYKEILAKTTYVIWLGRQESQGIALEEALSMDIPILVWDVTHLGHWKPTSQKEKLMFNTYENNYPNATCAYYFNEQCGLKITQKNDLIDSIDSMQKNWHSYTPRQYVINNLNLEKQARDFIYLYEKHYGITEMMGRNEISRTTKYWRNGTWYYKIYLQNKHKIKYYLQQIFS